MPADPHHSGAALIPSTTVGEAVGQERRPSTAANVDSCYGHESKTMTIYRACLTPAEANPPSASEHRLAKPQSGLTSTGLTSHDSGLGHWGARAPCQGALLQAHAVGHAAAPRHRGTVVLLPKVPLRSSSHRCVIRCETRRH